MGMKINYHELVIYYFKILFHNNKKDFKMRRKDREITDINEKLDIIKKCKHCRIGLSDHNFPYIVPLNYGYSFDNEKLILYFHSAKEGTKIDIIKNNNNVCFEIDCDTKLIEGEKACNYSYEYKSIIGFGKMQIIENMTEKTAALNYIMKHQTGKDIKFDYDGNEIGRVLILKMTVDSFTGKQRVM
jgi:nitroimidazol reductase NimA-like FMN-containing flavoprotein (pyridoxamine 5'-phosphate oxidase superfamily)